MKIGCCYYLSSAINPFLYSLLSKRFRNGFHDLKYKCFSKFRMFICRNISPNEPSRRKTENYTNTGINKSWIETFNMTPITTEKHTSRANSELIMQESNIQSNLPSSNIVPQKNQNCESTNLEKEMFLLALQINTTNSKGDKSKLSISQHSFKHKKSSNQRLQRMSRSCTWHDEFVAISHPSRTFKKKVMKRNGAKQSGRRYKVKRYQTRTNINIVINPQVFHRQPNFHLISNKLQRCPIVHDLRGVGMTFPNLLFDVKA